jgi:hypothetical protein
LFFHNKKAPFGAWCKFGAVRLCHFRQFWNSSLPPIPFVGFALTLTLTPTPFRQNVVAGLNLIRPRLEFTTLTIRYLTAQPFQRSGKRGLSLVNMTNRSDVHDHVTFSLNYVADVGIVPWATSSDDTDN